MAAPKRKPGYRPGQKFELPDGKIVKIIGTDNQMHPSMGKTLGLEFSDPNDPTLAQTFIYETVYMPAYALEQMGAMPMGRGGARKTVKVDKERVVTLPKGRVVISHLEEDGTWSPDYIAPPENLEDLTDVVRTTVKEVMVSDDPHVVKIVVATDGHPALGKKRRRARTTTP
jgi:hypothetical protein